MNESDCSTNTSYKVVVIGGGTGSAVLLRELKHFTKNITAVVTVADDGGSSGQLKKDLKMLPPGDIRNCIIALADEESRLKELMDYRFEKGRLKIHSFGNIFIAAMAQTSDNFAQAISEVSEVLRVTGRVLPVTTNMINLQATLKNGKVIKGESYIPKASRRQRSPIEHIEILPTDTRCYTPCIKAIMDADIIVYSPGSLYTSIIPNILVNGIVAALASTKAKKYFVVNIMNQGGETDNYTVKEHLQAFLRHADKKEIVDTIIYNTSKIDSELLKVYKQKDSSVPIDIPTREELENIEVEKLPLELVKIEDGNIRHDAKKLWQKIFEDYKATR